MNGFKAIAQCIDDKELECIDISCFNDGKYKTFEEWEKVNIHLKFNRLGDDNWSVRKRIVEEKTPMDKCYDEIVENIIFDSNKLSNPILQDILEKHWPLPSTLESTEENNVGPYLLITQAIFYFENLPRGIIDLAEVIDYLKGIKAKLES